MKRYLILIICLFTSALYFNMLQLPNKIVTGGGPGIAIIINYYFHIEPSKIILIISLILLILDYLLLGKNRAVGAIIATFIYPIFIDITSNYSLNINNLLIASIIIGILSGITTGITYKNGFSNGGFSIISELVSKYFKISLSLSQFIVNISIVLLGGFSIGLKMIIYSTLILIIHSLIIEKIVNSRINRVTKR